jgi:hypothetical protein
LLHYETARPFPPCLDLPSRLSFSAAQVRRDDALDLINEAGGDEHDACKAAFTQSLNKTSVSTPGATTVDQSGMNTTSNDIPYGNVPATDYDYGGRIELRRSTRRNATCVATGIQCGTCVDCYPMVMASEVHLAGVVDHPNSNQTRDDLGHPYQPLGNGLDGSAKSTTGYVRRVSQFKPHDLSMP